MSEKSLRLGVLALEGSMLSSVAGPMDTLRVAQRLAQLRLGERAPRMEAVAFSARGATSVRTAHGIDIAGLAHADQHFDMVVVPGVMHQSAANLIEQLDRFEPEIELLRHLHLRGVPLAASCSGTFVLAHSGLLNGHRATTSWWLAAAFRQQFPRVELQADAMLLTDGPFTTTGAATAMYGLLIKLVSGVGGDELGQQTARMLALDPDRQSQAPYVSDALIETPRNSLSERVEKFLNKQLHTELSIGALAEHCNTSERSLLRHFKSNYGVGPLAYIQRLRVERAKALLETTHLSVDEIVTRCGYSDVSSFRKLFKRATSITPNDYRERFRLRAR
jgi:transcriptional regulator GlxA family with amidase domain